MEFASDISLLILACFLTGSLRLLLASYAWLLVMLSLAKLCHDAIASARSLKSLKSAFQALVFLNDNLCHLLVSPPDVVEFAVFIAATLKLYYRGLKKSTAKVFLYRMMQKRCDYLCPAPDTVARVFTQLYLFYHNIYCLLHKIDTICLINYSFWHIII